MKQALSAITNGGALLSVAKTAKVGTIALMLGFRPSLGADMPSDDHLQELHQRLLAANETAPDAQAHWPDDSERGKRYLRSILMTARALLPLQVAAVARASVAEAAPSWSVRQSPAAGVHSPAAHQGAPLASSLQYAPKGSEMIAAAKAFFPAMENEYAADKQPKHELVGKLHAAFVNREPYAVPLTDYTLQLQVSSVKEVAFDLLGESYVKKDSTAKSVKIDSHPALLKQMRRRKAANCAAGAFDVTELARSRSQEPPPRTRCGLSRQSSTSRATTR